MRANWLYGSAHGMDNQCKWQNTPAIYCIISSQPNFVLGFFLKQGLLFFSWFLQLLYCWSKSHSEVYLLLVVNIQYNIHTILKVLRPMCRFPIVLISRWCVPVSLVASGQSGVVSPSLIKTKFYNITIFTVAYIHVIFKTNNYIIYIRSCW